MNLDDTMNMEYAEIAYEAYRKHSNGVSLISGATIPEFVRLPDAIKDAWQAAARAVIDKFDAEPPW